VGGGERGRGGGATNKTRGKMKEREKREDKSNIGNIMLYKKMILLVGGLVPR